MLDDESSVQSNGAFLSGILAAIGGGATVQFYEVSLYLCYVGFLMFEPILNAVQRVLNCGDDAAEDNACGLLARLIVSAPANTFPINQVSPHFSYFFHQFAGLTRAY